MWNGCAGGWCFVLGSLISLHRCELRKYEAVERVLILFVYLFVLCCPRSREKQMECNDLITFWNAWKNVKSKCELIRISPGSWVLNLRLVVFLTLFICVTIAYTLLLKMIILKMYNVTYVLSFSGHEGCITTQLLDFLWFFYIFAIKAMMIININKWFHDKGICSKILWMWCDEMISV